jgi:xylan 1,4-beta-xylosidase
MLRTSLIVFAFCLCSKVFGQLVLPGDYPDPSVVKIGNDYWASATTSNWGPIYPLLKSSDLVNWETKAFVFNQVPSWADFYFWAPEITYENGKVYVYYAAHKVNGNLCLGIASADKPEGPYNDHGPLMCEPAGSIDAFPMRDANGKLYLIWKEDGNSIKQPTPIWAMEMTEDRKALVGEKKELFRNDKPWEGNLVEGVSMVKHGRYYYAFYAGAGCCGRGCTYATGVARAENLLGPWEKYEQNPVLQNDDEWKCPGHGTVIEKDGRFYFLYHAYENESDVYTGRQGLLKEFKFTNDGWIEFLPEQKIQDVATPAQVVEEFDSNSLSAQWQWSVFQKAKYQVSNGKLVLNALPEKSGAFVGHKTLDDDYTTTVVIATKATDAEAGLAAVGDEKNIVAVSFKGNTLRVSRIEGDKETYLPEKKIKPRENVYLRMKVSKGKDLVFSYSTNGKKFKVLNGKAVDGFFLPPWDRAVRIGLISKGTENQKATFEHFDVKYK